MELENLIASDLKRLDLLPLAQDQLDCLQDTTRVQEAARMLEDLRDRCGVRLPLPKGDPVGGPFPTADAALQHAERFLDGFAVIAVDEMATDAARSGNEASEYYVTGYMGPQAALALAGAPAVGSVVGEWKTRVRGLR